MGTIEVTKVYRGGKGEKPEPIIIQTNITYESRKTGRTFDYSKMRTLRENGWTWEQIKEEFFLCSLEEMFELIRKAKEPVKAFLAKEAAEARRRAEAERRKRAEEEAAALEAFEQRRVSYSQRHKRRKHV